jgi:hypothetical protein
MVGTAIGHGRAGTASGIRRTRERENRQGKLEPASGVEPPACGLRIRIRQISELLVVARVSPFFLVNQDVFSILKILAVIVGSVFSGDF